MSGDHYCHGLCVSELERKLAAATAQLERRDKDASRLCEDHLIINRDGDAWCAYRAKSFVNLEESLSGFGNNPLNARRELLNQEEAQT
jgi:hypothetical protein